MTLLTFNFKRQWCKGTIGFCFMSEFSRNRYAHLLLRNIAGRRPIEIVHRLCLLSLGFRVVINTQSSRFFKLLQLFHLETVVFLESLLFWKVINMSRDLNESGRNYLLKLGRTGQSWFSIQDDFNKYFVCLDHARLVVLVLYHPHQPLLHPLQRAQVPRARGTDLFMSKLHSTEYWDMFIA